MKNESIRPLRTIRSFVIREGRFTDAQKNAVAKLWPNLGIEIESAYPLNLNDYFLTLQPLVFDIGFGNGESLISIAQQRSDLNFVGIEVYRPGIGMVLRKIEELDLNNIRIINADVMNVLSKINDDSLLGVLIWFPDPWPKKRHQKRRLIQKEFLLEIIRVLQSRGTLHMASDWEPYAEYMEDQSKQIAQFSKVESNRHPLNIKRPLTKFEQKGLRKGHKVTDLIYQISDDI